MGTYQGQPILNTASTYSTSADQNLQPPSYYNDPASTAVTANANSTFALQNGGSLTASGKNGTGLAALNANVSISGGTISAVNGMAVDAKPGSFSGGGPGGVVMISGGSLTGTIGLRASSSTVTVSGGTISGNDADFHGNYSDKGAGLYTFGGSNIAINGGTISGNVYGIASSNSGSNIMITGGTITSGSSTSGVGGYPGGIGLYAYGGTVGISGSSVYGGSAGIVVSNTGIVTVSGGSISSNGGSITSSSATLNAQSGGTILISGGSISSGNGFGLLAINNGVIDLFGTFDGYKPGDKITSGSGTITGTLLNGQAFSTTYFAGIAGQATGTIEFNVAPAPEPSQFAALGIGVLGLSALTLRVRRRACAV